MRLNWLVPALVVAAIGGCGDDDAGADVGVADAAGDSGGPEDGGRDSADMLDAPPADAWDAAEPGCPWELEPVLCTDGGECAEGEMCLAGRCMPSCEHTLADYEDNLLAPEIRPISNTCRLGRHPDIRVTDDDGCERVFLHDRNTFGESGSDTLRGIYTRSELIPNTTVSADLTHIHDVESREGMGMASGYRFFDMRADGAYSIASVTWPALAQVEVLDWESGAASSLDATGLNDADWFTDTTVLVAADSLDGVNGGVLYAMEVTDGIPSAATLIATAPNPVDTVEVHAGLVFVGVFGASENLLVISSDAIAAVVAGGAALDLATDASIQRFDAPRSFRVVGDYLIGNPDDFMTWRTITRAGDTVTLGPEAPFLNAAAPVVAIFGSVHAVDGGLMLIGRRFALRVEID